jgi:hypothetical protein
MIKISMLTSNGSGSLLACWFPFNSYHLQGNVMTNVVNMASLITKSMTFWKVDPRVNPNTQCLWIAFSIYKKKSNPKNPKNNINLFNKPIKWHNIHHCHSSKNDWWSLGWLGFSYTKHFVEPNLKFFLNHPQKFESSTCISSLWKFTHNEFLLL